MLGDAEVAIQRGVLRDEPDADERLRLVEWLVAEHSHGPAGRFPQADRQSHQRGLARAARPTSAAMRPRGTAREQSRNAQVRR